MAEHLSRHELKIKRRRLVEKANEVKKHREATGKILKTLNDSYIEQSAHFPVSRYGRLKRMIKAATSEANLTNLKKWVEESKEGYREDDRDEDEDGGGTSGLLAKSNEILDQIEEAEKKGGRPLTTGGKPLGILDQAVRKVQKMTGFYSDPIEDEDVMSDEQLHKNIQKQERTILACHNDMNKALHALVELRSKYEASKSRLFPQRYRAMKRMVKDVVTITKAESSYEDIRK